MSIDIRKALRAYLKIRPDVYEDDLFLGQRGPLSEWGIHAIVKKYAYQARQEDITAHTLRHSFGKNLVDADTPLDQVATLLGHESLDTARIYTQPSERDLQRAVQRAAGENIGENGSKLGSVNRFNRSVFCLVQGTASLSAARSVSAV